MILRSAVALTALATGLGALISAAGAQQPYPPYGAQQYPPYQAQPYPNRAPAPQMAPEEDDEDDIPPQQRAAPGYYPPPPGYRGPYAYEPRPPQGVPEVDRRPLPAPNAGPGPYGDRGPTVIYGDRPPADPRYAPPGADPRYSSAPPPYGPPPAGPYAAPPQQGPYGPPPAGPYGASPPYDQQPMPIGPQDSARPPRDVTGTVPPNTVATLPPEDQPETTRAELPPEKRRQLVPYQTAEPAGTLIIDTANTYLYLVLGNGQAMRYGIGVGREGFTWAGAERISKMAEWPDWHPPAEMIERQPYLPRFMAGGEGNPLGARALYLGKTLYRIHGTNQPSTIGKYVSSGCIRLTNEDISDLYTRVQVGTRVVVLAGAPPPATAENLPPPAPPIQPRR